MPANPPSFVPTQSQKAAWTLIQNWMRSRETPPRMTTTQRNLLSNVTPGTTIFNTTTNQMNYWNGTVWVAY